MSDVKLSNSDVKLYNRLLAMRLIELAGGKLVVRSIRRFLGLIGMEDFEHKDKDLIEYFRSNVSDPNSFFNVYIDENTGIIIRKTKEYYYPSNFGSEFYVAEICNLKDAHEEISEGMSGCKKDEFKKKVKKIIKKRYVGIQDYMIRMAILEGKFDNSSFRIFGDQIKLARILGSFLSDRKDIIHRRFSRIINYDYFEDDGWDFLEMFIFLDIVTDGVLDFNFIQEEYGKGMFEPESDPMSQPGVLGEMPIDSIEEHAMAEEVDEGHKSDDYGDDSGGGFD